MTLVCNLLLIYSLVVLARIVLSFFDVPSDHPVGRVRHALSLVVDPVLRPIRAVLPPVRLGSVGLDLSPLILFLAISLLRSFLC
ncbi:MAG TPA: YggT family protein [Acidimicrobiia bacterium]|jgi:YggT family protein|nr:YggT family protein [Acidimicrobiia bacterium]